MFLLQKSSVQGCQLDIFIADFKHDFEHWLLYLTLQDGSQTWFPLPATTLNKLFVDFFTFECDFTLP